MLAGIFSRTKTSCPCSFSRTVFASTFCGISLILKNSKNNNMNGNRNFKRFSLDCDHTTATKFLSSHRFQWWSLITVQNASARHVLWFETGDHITSVIITTCHLGSCTICLECWAQMQCHWPSVSCWSHLCQHVRSDSYLLWEQLSLPCAQAMPSFSTFNRPEY